METRNDSVQQTGKVRICLTDERQDIAVDQSLHKPGTLYTGEYGNEDADHDERYSALHNFS